MPNLVPVDHDPFAVTPVDHDPFAAAFSAMQVPVASKKSQMAANANANALGQLGNPANANALANAMGQIGNSPDANANALGQAASAPQSIDEFHAQRAGKWFKDRGYSPSNDKFDFGGLLGSGIDPEAAIRRWAGQ